METTKKLCDEETTLAELKRRVLAFSEERDWIQFHSPKNLSMALAAEAGELMEHYLWAGSEESRSMIHDAKKGPRIREELADILIYAIEFANMNNIDLASAIEQKMVLNAQKYPADKARGRSDKYTEL
jgi:dCTP diphosphatase